MTCIIYDLGALGVTQNIQIMGFLQDKLFTIDLWIWAIYQKL